MIDIATQDGTDEQDWVVWLMGYISQKPNEMGQNGIDILLRPILPQPKDFHPSLVFIYDALSPILI